MSLFWHSSREERGHLVRTLNELGPTTVPGLSAALSWPEKRTERLVRELARSGEGGVVYNAASRCVEIPSLAPPTPVETTPAVPIGPVGPVGPPASVPTPSAAVITSRWGGRMLCPACSGSMEPTAHSEALVCRECGQISSIPRSTRSTPSVGPSPLGGPAAPAPAGDLPDRRLQELFAAYVSSRPVICPKCKTPLRHRGLGMYGCPACGQVVRFVVDSKTGEPAR